MLNRCECIEYGSEISTSRPTRPKSVVEKTTIQVLILCRGNRKEEANVQMQDSFSLPFLSAGTQLNSTRRRPRGRTTPGLALPISASSDEFCMQSQAKALFLFSSVQLSSPSLVAEKAKLRKEGSLGGSNTREQLTSLSFAKKEKTNGDFLRDKSLALNGLDCNSRLSTRREDTPAARRGGRVTERSLVGLWMINTRGNSKLFQKERKSYRNPEQYQ